MPEDFQGSRGAALVLLPWDSLDFPGDAARLRHDGVQPGSSLSRVCHVAVRTVCSPTSNLGEGAQPLGTFQARVEVEIGHDSGT